MRIALAWILGHVPIKRRRIDGLAGWMARKADSGPDRPPDQPPDQPLDRPPKGPHSCLNGSRLRHFRGYGRLQARMRGWSRARGVVGRRFKCMVGVRFECAVGCGLGCMVGYGLGCAVGCGLGCRFGCGLGRMVGCGFGFGAGVLASHFGDLRVRGAGCAYLGVQ